MSQICTHDKTVTLLNAMADSAACVRSVATFGAIAEYHGTSDHPSTLLRHTDSLTLTSDQGAMRLTFHPKMRLVAYEGLSKIPELWSQGISLCLPADQAKMRGNTVITALGPETRAICSDGQGMQMFDLGVGAMHMDACVRTDDEDLIQLFDKFCGTPLFAGCDELIAAILDRSPTRVFSSALARIEVHTHIPASDSVTPHGAHTHVLPELLAHGRSFAATVPIPDGWLPGLNLFPDNPARNAHGNAKDFDSGAHKAFQAIMADFADPEVVAIKNNVIDKVLDGRGPETMKLSESRTLRTALRVALRQLRFTHGPSDNLESWARHFEPNNQIEVPTVDE